MSFLLRITKYFLFRRCSGLGGVVGGAAVVMAAGQGRPLMKRIGGAVSLLLISLVLFLFDLRTIIMVVGSVKFLKNLVVPGWESNNELLDFLSRVPDDRLLEETRELPAQ